LTQNHPRGIALTLDVTYGHYYTEKAQEMLDLAERAASPRARNEFLKLALEYDTLAKTAGEDQPPLKQA
jgi:hypothetical protein